MRSLSACRRVKFSAFVVGKGRRGDARFPADSPLKNLTPSLSESAAAMTLTVTVSRDPNQAISLSSEYSVLSLVILLNVLPISRGSFRPPWLRKFLSRLGFQGLSGGRTLSQVRIRKALDLTEECGQSASWPWKYGRVAKYKQGCRAKETNHRK
jgi:hypothetical protein